MRALPLVAVQRGGDAQGDSTQAQAEALTGELPPVPEVRLLEKLVPMASS
jgi:hypothetical protein